MLSKRLLITVLALIFVGLSCSLPPFAVKATGTPEPGPPLPPAPSENTPVAQPTLLQPTPTLQVEYERAQIAFLFNLYLTYDPAVWEAMESAPGTQNRQGESIMLLRHRAYDCTLEENLGMGAPDTWEREVSQKQIGALLYQVETWRDTTSGAIVLTVYQYPAGEPREDSKRIELITNDRAEQCLNDAEAVLALSEAEIR